MTVEPIVPDAPPATGEPMADSTSFARALDAIGAALTGASRAEDEFAYGRGTLQAAIYERARADVALAVATSTAQRLTQAISSVINMQV